LQHSWQRQAQQPRQTMVRSPSRSVLQILLKSGQNHCASCSVPLSRAILIESAKLGRIATHSPEAEALRAATQCRQIAARKAWQSADKPDWLSEQFYSQRIQPKLAKLSNSAIASALLYPNPAQPTFAQADVARIHGIGGCWEGREFFTGCAQRAQLDCGPVTRSAASARAGHPSTAPSFSVLVAARAGAWTRQPLDFKRWRWAGATRPGPI